MFTNLAQQTDVCKAGTLTFQKATDSLASKGYIFQEYIVDSKIVEFIKGALKTKGIKESTDSFALFISQTKGVLASFAEKCSDTYFSISSEGVVNVLHMLRTVP